MSASGIESAAVENITRPAMAQANRRSLGKLRELLCKSSSPIDTIPHDPKDLDEEVEEVELVSPNNSIRITVCSLGATVVSIKLKSGQEVTFQEGDWMANYKGYNGRTCGRMAGRTNSYRVNSISASENGEDAQFHTEFDDKNEAEVLHGGKIGLSFRAWKLVNTFISQKCARAVFEVESMHQDQGHPGGFKVEAHIMAVDGEKPRFDIRFRARLLSNSSCQALVNLTSHCYFNLGGGANALEHELHLPNGNSYMPEHFSTLPMAVSGVFDFTKGLRAVGVPFDHCFLLSDPVATAPETAIAAELFSPKSGVKMTVHSTCPSVVVYTAQHANHKGICLELQYPPNFANMTHEYRYRTTLSKVDGIDEHNKRQRPDENRLYSRLAALGRKGSTSLSSLYGYDELIMHEFSVVKD